MLILILTKAMDVAQPIWLSDRSKKGNFSDKITKNAFLALKSDSNYGVVWMKLKFHHFHEMWFIKKSARKTSAYYGF